MNGLVDANEFLDIDDNKFGKLKVNEKYMLASDDGVLHT